MITSIWNEYSLSRLMLGTVQFGQPYGVANRIGQPDDRTVRDIIECAVEGGVNCLDTAAVYGTSEDVIGRIIHELKIADRVVIVTKVRALTSAELSHAGQAALAIEQSLAESRKRLRLDCLPIVLFHRECDAIHHEVLCTLRDRGWLRYYGVSCDHLPDRAREFARSGRFSALQIPGNLIDQRHRQGGVLSVTREQGVAVFLRSVYLQGLLVMPEADIPPALRDVIPVRRQLAALAADAGIGLAELALRAAISDPDLTCIITGVETVAQVRDNLAMFERGCLPDDLLDRISEITPGLPELIITPRLWPPIASRSA